MSEANQSTNLNAAQPLSVKERTELLRLARTAIGAVLGVVEAPQPHLLTANLVEPGGAFVTLHLEGVLRGCIGTLRAQADALYETVIRTARAAAFEDPRFPPVAPAEWRRVQIEISRLGRLERSSPEAVIAGVHGVHIVRGPARALLLPQVAQRYAWDTRRLLREVCRKAGLCEDAWREPETEVQIFTAEIFGDEGA